MKNKRDYIESFLYNLDESELINIYNEYAIANNYEQIYDNNETFFIDMFGDRVYDAVRSAMFGDYSFHADYVTIDGYGNLDGFNDPTDFIEIGVLAEWLCDNQHKINNAAVNLEVVWEEMEDDFKDKLEELGYNRELIDDFADYDPDLSFEENFEEFKAYLKELEMSNEMCKEE